MTFARLERRLQALAAKNSAWQTVRGKTRRKKKQADRKMKKQLENNNEKLKIPGNHFEKDAMLIADGDDLDDWGTQWKETRELMNLALLA